MDWENSLRNPQAYGIAATALMTALIKELVAKGVLSSAEAARVVSVASNELRTSGTGPVRSAREIIEKEVLPDFPGQ